MKIDINILNEEFEKWIHTYGNGRNKKDLRFGQYLHFKYDLPLNNEVNDGFYDEMPLNAYNNITILLSNIK